MSATELGTWGDVVFMDVFSSNGSKYSVAFSFDSKIIQLFKDNVEVKRFT